MKILSFLFVLLLSDFIYLQTFGQNLDSFGAKKISNPTQINLFEFRTWESSKGDSINAKVLEVKSENIKVVLRDGSKLEIPIQNLSSQDQDVIMIHQHTNEDTNRINFYEPRVWKSKDGKVLRGKIERVENNTVFVRRTDGRVVPLPHRILSAKDLNVLKVYSSRKSLLSNEDLEYILGMHKWRDRTDRHWQIQLEFSQTSSSDGRKILVISHRNNGNLMKVNGSWAIENNNILFTSAGNGGNDVRWKCPKSKNDRKALVSEIGGYFNYFGFCMASNLVLVPDR